MFDDLDLFGKEAEIYYKGKSKRSSGVGKIYSLIYIMVYLAFLIYSLVKMFKREDMTFYDSYAFNGEVPSIEVNPDIFNFAFALFNYSSSRIFTDLRAISVAAFYVTIKDNDYNSRTAIPLQTETCKLENFGKKYQPLFKEKNVENFICIKNLNLSLQGHISYNLYSSIVLQFTPCSNITHFFIIIFL